MHFFGSICKFFLVGVSGTLVEYRYYSNFAGTRYVTRGVITCSSLFIKCSLIKKKVASITLRNAHIAYYSLASITRIDAVEQVVRKYL